jgi:hypothetical protein
MLNQFLRPAKDEVHIKVDMNKEDMDTFVFCVASKKTAARCSKEMADLVRNCHDIFTWAYLNFFLFF